MCYHIVPILFFVVVLSTEVLAQSPLRLIAPNGGESFVYGDTMTIRWEGVPADEEVALELSRDGGVTWELITMTAVGHQYEWTVRTIPSPLCRIRIVRITDAETSQRIFWHPDFAVSSATINPAGTLLLTTGNSGALLWDLAKDLRIDSIPLDTLWAFGDLIRDGAFSHDGEFVLIGDERYATVTKLTSDSMIHKLNLRTPVNSVDYTLDDTKFMIATGDGASIHDAETAEKLHVFDKSGPAPLHSQSMHPNGRRILLHGTFEYDTSSSKPIRTFALRGWDGAYSPDGTLIAVTEWEHVQLLDVGSGELLRLLRGPVSASMEYVEFDQEGRRLAVADGNGTVSMWNVETGEIERTLYGTTRFQSARFSIDGRYLVTSALDHTARIWDLSVPKPTEDVSDGLVSILLPQTTDVVAEPSTASSPLRIFPNLTGGGVEIRYHVDHAAHVRIRIYDANGALIATLVDETHEPGMRNHFWHGDGLATGIYLLHFQADDRCSTEIVRITR